MSRRKRIRASLAMIAAGFAFGATSAAAMPMQDGTPPARAAAAASLAAEQAQTQASAQDTLRSQRVVVRHADLRGEQAKQAARDNGRATPAVVQAPPKGSTIRVTGVHSAQPPADDSGTDVSLIAMIIGLAGAGLLGAVATVAVTKTTRSHRAPVA